MLFIKPYTFIKLLFCKFIMEDDLKLDLPTAWDWLLAIKTPCQLLDLGLLDLGL